MKANFFLAILICIAGFSQAGYAETFSDSGIRPKGINSGSPGLAGNSNDSQLDARKFGMLLDIYIPYTNKVLKKEATGNFSKITIADFDLFNSDTDSGDHNHNGRFNPDTSIYKPSAENASPDSSTFKEMIQTAHMQVETRSILIKNDEWNPVPASHRNTPWTNLNIIELNQNLLDTNKTYQHRSFAKINDQVKEPVCVNGEGLIFTPGQKSGTITGDTATDITFYSARLQGMINPEGLPTQVGFEIGIDITYGIFMQATPEQITGNEPIGVEASISGISAQTIFHFRVKVENENGVFYGEDKTFLTLPKPEKNFSINKARTENLISEYTDISGNGNLIEISNTDEAFSSPVDIGFTFNFAGADFDQFILNTNGFIKMGTVPTSETTQHLNLPDDYAGGNFSSQIFNDIYIISPFNHDLESGTNLAEFRVLTLGNSGSKVCIIQFKNLREKIEPPFRQFENLEFQVKLYESTNVIEFVYGDWQPSSYPIVNRVAIVGLKGAGNQDNQVLSVWKWHENPWTQVDFWDGNYYEDPGWNAFDYSHDPGLMPESGRTFRFYPKQKKDATVAEIYTLGKLPIPYGLPHTIGAYIKNTGYDTLYNIPVQLDVTGSNLFSASTNIPLIKPDSGVVVNFQGYAPNVEGFNNVNINLPNEDDFSFDNTKTFIQETTKNSYNYCDSLGYYYCVGMMWIPGPGSPGTEWLVKYHVNGTKNIQAARIGLGYGADHQVYAIVLNSLGQQIAQSTNYHLTSETSWRTVTFEFPNHPVITDSDFYIGLVQTESQVTYFPMGFQVEDPIRRNAYFTTSINGTPHENITGLARYCIEAIMDSGFCMPNFGYVCADPYYGQFINSFVTSGGITNISNLNTACSGNSNNYTFFQNQIVTAEQGIPFNFEAQGSFSWNSRLDIWADWNRDGDFYDTLEMVHQGVYSIPGKFIGKINIPISAETGNTTLRVVLHDSFSASNPCGWYSSGETEDYTLNVVTATPMMYQAGTTFQCDTLAQISGGNIDIPIIGVKIDVTGALDPLVVTSFNLSAFGTSDFENDVTAIKIYYSANDSVFSANQLFGSAVDPDNPISGSAMLTYGTNYFWVAFDISSSATVGNYLDAACISYSISGLDNQFPNISTPAGSLIINYCIPEFIAVWGCDEGYGINSFATTGGFTNITNPENGCPTNMLCYSKFTDQTVTVDIGSTLQFNYSSTGEYAHLFIYIDWNRDFDFDESNESVYYNWGENWELSGEIVIPTEALPGTTRLRVIAAYLEPEFPKNILEPGCSFMNGFGECEDYQITVLPGSPMTYQTGTTFQCDTLPPISRGSLNNTIIGIKLDMTGSMNPLSVTSFSLNSEGCSNFAHDVSLVNIFCTDQDSLFSANQLFGSATSLNYPVAGNKILTPGKNFFWVTYNVSDTANMGDNLDAACTSYTIGADTITPFISSPYGKQIIDYCIPFFPDTTVCSMGSAINNFSTTGGTTNITNLNSGCPENSHGYSKFTNQFVSVSQGSVISFYYSSNGGAPGFFILADWNQDFDFDEENETVYANTDESESELFGDIVVPNEASTGSTRLRLITNSAEGMKSTITAGCGYMRGWGETEDYTMVILSEPLSTQIIDLPAGWSGFSTYLQPENSELDGMMAPIDNELIILNDFNQVYWPGENLNTFNDGWHSTFGAQIKLSNAASLPVDGRFITRQAYLNPGWNYLPVLSECPVDVSEWFSPLQTMVKVVKDIAGTGVYWPEYNINTLQELNPGKAYFIYWDIALSLPLLFPECEKAELVYSPTPPQILVSPWNEPAMNPGSHLVAFPEEVTRNLLETGDIIGSFNSNGYCSGISVFEDCDFAQVIFGDDPLTPGKDGFTTGEPLAFRIYRPSTNEMFDIIAEFESTGNQNSWIENGLSVVQSLQIVQTGAGGGCGIDIFPNPGNGKFEVRGLTSPAKISVRSVGGERVFTAQNFTGGQIDLGNCAPGLFVVDILTLTQSFNFKLVIE